MFNLTTFCLVGTTLVKGHLHTHLTNTTENDLHVTLSDILPWSMSIFFHDMQVQLEEGEIKTSSSPHDYALSFVPAIDRKRPAQLELSFILPAKQAVRIILSFEKALMRIGEFPPDRHRGIDIPPALIYYKQERHQLNYHRMHTQNTVLTLPIPDNTMPFNVIMIVCTVVGVAFGILFNLLYYPVKVFNTQDAEKNMDWRMRVKSKIKRVFVDKTIPFLQSRMRALKYYGQTPKQD